MSVLRPRSVIPTNGRDNPIASSSTRIGHALRASSCDVLRLKSPYIGSDFLNSDLIFSTRPWVGGLNFLSYKDARYQVMPALLMSEVSTDTIQFLVRIYPASPSVLVPGSSRVMESIFQSDSIAHL